MIKSIVLSLPFLLYSCLPGEDDFVRHELVTDPMISTNKQASNKKGFYLKDYDLTVYTLSDTILLEKYGWIEKEWFQKLDDKNDVYFEASKKIQLVFPLGSEFCNVEEAKLRESFEILDDKWKYTASMGVMHSYKIDGTQLPKEITLYTEENNKRVNKLVFTKRE